MSLIFKRKKLHFVRGSLLKDEFAFMVGTSKLTDVD